ncbi:hypothetical protein SDC9_185304 [bioreactor metagenome]|uniref:Uncharacterized protein n=1 Tax=bioreactor metagenome TaxID=1076179 RepID=A0A645HR02_9ZZZZ
MKNLNIRCDHRQSNGSGTKGQMPGADLAAFVFPGNKRCDDQHNCHQTDQHRISCTCRHIAYTTVSRYRLYKKFQHGSFPPNIQYSELQT